MYTRRHYIRELMDSQLKCVFPDRLAELNTEECPGPEMEITLNGKPKRVPVDIRQPSDPINVGDVEDGFIEALDRKYSGVFSRDYKILEYMSLGYTQAEAGRIFGVSHQRVHQVIKKLRED